MDRKKIINHKTIEDDYKLKSIRVDINEPDMDELDFRINRDLWPEKTREREEKEFQERLKIARKADRDRKRKLKAK